MIQNKWLKNITQKNFDPFRFMFGSMISKYGSATLIIDDNVLPGARTKIFDIWNKIQATNSSMKELQTTYCVSKKSCLYVYTIYYILIIIQKVDKTSWTYGMFKIISWEGTRNRRGRPEPEAHKHRLPETSCCFPSLNESCLNMDLECSMSKKN